MTIALEFAGVSKRFILQHERPESLQERFVQVFRPRPADAPFWALRDVSFQVNDGETFGILGRNGAGKSTLLKLATGILKPTSGAIQKHRRTYAMLELGAGFHPELTGRDNIYLNGSIHGLSRAQMRRLFDQIVAFAELEEFIDTPVKHFSSGMFMRLGFATAIHMQPELLVIDEILAVGDAAFRRKCNEALWNLRRDGVTILFVSHNEEAVYQFCDRALLLADGRVAALGATDDVIAAYAQLLDERGGPAGADQPARLAVHAAAVLDQHGRETLTLAPDQPWAIEVVVATPPGPASLEGEVTLHTDTGSHVVAASLDLALPDDGARLRHLRVTLDPLPLSAGRLRLNVRLACTADGGLTLAEYEAPQSITVGGHGQGPLVRVPYRWVDRTAGPLPPTPLPIDGGPSPVSARASHDARPAFVRSFAEGDTSPEVETRLRLVNPWPEPCAVGLAFHYGETCDGPASARLIVGAEQAEVVDLADLVGRGKEVATVLAADRPLLAEREMIVHAYPAVGGVAYNRPRVAGLRAVSGGHLSGGATTAAPVWSFAEGYTGPGFDLYLAILNPGDERASITLTYYLADGRVERRVIELDAGRRRTVAVHDSRDPAGLGPDQIFWMQAAASDSAAIVVERMSYFLYVGASTAARGVSASPGVTEPASTWLFAAVDTGTGSDAYLALANPHARTLEATVRHVIEGQAEIVERRLAVPAHGRVTVAVHEPASEMNPAGLGRGHVAAVQVIGTAPFIAERSTYREAAGGCSQAGATTPAQVNQARLFTLGADDTADAATLAILNLDPAPAAVHVERRGHDGWGECATIAVPPSARVTAPIPAEAPLAVGRRPRPSAEVLRVTVAEAGPRGVVVERLVQRRPGTATATTAASFGELETVSLPAPATAAGAGARQPRGRAR